MAAFAGHQPGRPFLAIHALAGLMPAGASIVNTSSTAGLTGYFSAAYGQQWGCAD